MDLGQVFRIAIMTVVTSVFAIICTRSFSTSPAGIHYALGALHSVVFAGFSHDAIRERILDAQCKVSLLS